MRKLKYLSIIIMLFIFSSLVVTSITNSRYLASVEMTGLANIGYTIFELSEYQNTSVEKYDSSTQTLTIAPGETNTLRYQITNKDNTYYNQMNLTYQLRVVDIISDNALSFKASINGEDYTQGAAKGIAWDGKSEDTTIFDIAIECSKSIYEQKNLKYQVVAEATSTDGNVVVRRVINLNIKVFDTYTITYELNQHGTNPEQQPTKFELGETVTLLEPTSDTREFLGWYENPDFSGSATTVFSGKNSDQTFYAKWQEKNTHILKVTSIPSDATVTYSSTDQIEGTAQGGFEERFIEGSTVTVTVTKDNYETVVKEYEIGTEDRNETIEIRRLYKLALEAKKIEYGEESDTEISYTINQPASSSINASSESGTKEGSMSGYYPVGTVIDVTVSKDNYETITKSYTIGNNDVTEKIVIRRLYYVYIVGKAIDNNTESDAKITYTINQPASISKESINSTGTNTGIISGDYTEGTTISITVWKENYESATENYTINSENINQTINIRRMYSFQLVAKAIFSGTETDATIKYTINQPSNSGNTTVQTTGSINGTLSGNYPIGTTINVTVSKDGYTTVTKSYSIQSENVSDKVTIKKICSFTLTANSPASFDNVSITFSIKNNSGELISGNLNKEATKSKTIKVTEGTIISWTAESQYYKAKTGSYTVNSENASDSTTFSDYRVAATTPSGVSSPAGTSGSGVNDLADANKKTQDMSLFSYAELEKNETIYYTFNADSGMKDNALVTNLKIQYIVCYGLRNAKVNIGLYLNGTKIASSTNISADYLTTNYNKRKTWNVDTSKLNIKASDIKNGNLKFGITCTTNGCNVFAADITPSYINPSN